MSMRAWTEQGYGFALFNGNNLKNIIDFIIDNSNLSFDERNELLDSHDEWEMYEVMGDTACSVVAAIINRKEGSLIISGYDSCGDTNQDSMIGIAPSYPWDGAKRMSQEEACKLLFKYAIPLGITEAPHYFEASYFG